MSCSNAVCSDNYHSRFKGRSMDPWMESLANIPQIKWKCPPKFVLSYLWHVAAGEESEEAKTQKHKEGRRLEGVYPRHADIPPSPSLPLDLQEDHLDDSHIPLIPITPVEEGAVDLPSVKAAPQNDSFDSQSLTLLQDMLSGNPSAPACDLPASLKPSTNEKPALEELPDFQADVVAAAAVAMTAIVKSKEQGSLIDTNLLIKLLSDPKMIEKLSDQGAPAGDKTEPVSGSNPLIVAMPGPKPDSVVQKLTNEHRATANTGTELPLIEKLIKKYGAPTDTGAAPISGLKPVTSPAAFPSPKPDLLLEKLIQKYRAPTDTGTAPFSGLQAVSFPAAFSSLKPDPVIEKLIVKYTAPTDTRAAPIYGAKPVTSLAAFPSPKPDPVIEKLVQKYTALTDTGAGPVSGFQPVTFPVAFPNPRPEPVVKKLIDEHRVPADAGDLPCSIGKLLTSPASLPSSNQDLVNIQRMINEYGTENEPFSRFMSLPLQRPISSLELNVDWPARMNSHPLQYEVESALLLKELSPDAVRPNLNTTPNVMLPDLRRKGPSPDTAPRLNLPPMPNVVQPSLHMKALSPDTVQTPSFSAMNAPPIKDINYFKSLVKQHGELRVTTQDFYNLSQSGNFDIHLQDLKSVPNLKPNESSLLKAQKPCIYFNGPKGCRNGSSCPYRHDRKPIMWEAQTAKRMKLGGEITGRT